MEGMLLLPISQGMSPQFTVVYFSQLFCVPHSGLAVQNLVCFHGAYVNVYISEGEVGAYNLQLLFSVTPGFHISIVRSYGPCGTQPLCFQFFFSLYWLISSCSVKKLKLEIITLRSMIYLDKKMYPGFLHIFDLMFLFILYSHVFCIHQLNVILSNIR